MFMLYKYLSPETFDKCFLRHRGVFQLRATQPSLLSDGSEESLELTVPKEGIHPHDGTLTFCLTLLGETLCKDIPILPMINGEFESPPLFFMDDGIPSSRAVFDISDLSRRILDDRFGVISFSGKWHNPQMWEKYAWSNADRGAGIVIALDGSKVREKVSMLEEVSYVKSPPRLALDTKPLDPLGLLFKKGKHWSREREVRAIVEVEKTCEVGEIDGRPINVVEFGEESVHALYVQKKTDGDVMDSVNNSFLKRLIRQVRRRRGSYRLEVV